MLGCIRLVKVKSQQKTYHMGKKIEKSGIRNLGLDSAATKVDNLHDLSNLHVEVIFVLVL